MNALFVFAGANDLESESNHSKLKEFYRLDNEIAQQQETKSYKELFHSLEYALLNARAKFILKQLDIL